MAILTKKFSEFIDGGDLEPDQKTAGIDSGSNALLNNVMPFLPTGTTAERPAITPSIYYRLRFNTTLESYEFYQPTIADWVQIEDSGDIADLLARLAAHTAGDGASMIGLENQSTIVDKTIQDMAEATYICQTNNGTLVNAQYLNLLANGLVSVTTGTGVLSSRLLVGTANQIDISNTDLSGNPVFSIPTTFNAPGTFNIASSIQVDEIIDDDTMVTATASNLSTAKAIKVYVDNSIAINITEVTGTTQAMAINNTYIANNAGLVTLTLPSTASLGDKVTVIGKGSGLYRIAQNASQTIYSGSSTTTTGITGYVDALDQYVSVTLICTTENNDWTVLGGFSGILDFN